MSSSSLSPANTSLARRRYPLRRSPPSRKRVILSRVGSSASLDNPRNSRLSRDVEIRPVLVPLHPNLRRLPSRILLEEKAIFEYQDSEMNARVGSKRKRVASGSNENAHSGRRSVRGPNRLKRFKSSRRSDATTSDEDELSSMDIDGESSTWPASRSKESSVEPESDDHLEGEEEDEGVDEDESSDDYLISSAPSRALNRLRKDDLIRLYTLAGLTDDAESLTKSEIIDSIISARDDLASLPPSSPLGRGAGSSDYSSDDAMVPEDDQNEEPTPRLTSSLRRRATTNDISRSSNRPLKGRSLSMGHLVGDSSPSHSRSMRRQASNKSGEGSSSSGSRRQRSRCSPFASGSTSSHSDSLRSPPAHHLRSRKISAPTLATASPPHLTDPSCLPTPVGLADSGVTPTTALAGLTFFSKSTNSKGKGKAKQVELNVPVESSGQASTTERTNGHVPDVHDSESDLTELEELEAQLAASRVNLSPRRLRSRDKERFLEKKVASSETLDARRITPMRKAKKNMKSLKEDDTSELSALDDELEEEEGDTEGVQEDEADEDEVDELVSSASATPPPPARTRRTPLRRRLRPRKGANVDPSDGDDEEEQEVEQEVELEEVDEELEEDGEEGEDDEMEAVNEDEDDEATIAVEPRKLRNGKIVGEEDVEIVEEEETGEEEEEEEEEQADDESVDLDGQGETDEEVMEDEDSIDLTVATAKTLVRLRRDDLVRLCESRDLEPVGTKPQLAEALLQWRDRQANDFSSPSSSGTARPPSTVKRRHRRRSQNESQKTASPPVLLRSGRVHLDEPRTPPVSGQNEKAAPDPELELDLGTLGLEDREIPSEKLQKLEKIGSGGFKDVFIGKFKGRRIAISEFRGQLSTMDIKELKLLSGFDHPNIVRFLGVSIPENTRETPVMIVSELCTNGDLFDYIRNVNPPTLHKVLSMMLDIARGLEYLHLRKPSVIHRDCKSSNILITSKGTAKIADFGLAKVKQSTRSMVRSLVGTVNWQAPELWHAHPKYNHKVDVFSCACVYWEMLQWHLPNKKFPWEGMNEHAIYEIVGSKRQRPSLNGLRKQWCSEIVDLIERMWAQDHQDRPTMSEVVLTLEDLVATY